MSIKVYTLNAFAKTESGGNAAGVVLNADSLSVEEMQKISAKVGFSETAFVKKSNKADFKVEFYTPNSEVDLCGHATIGTFTLLAHKGIISKGEYSQETKAGILKIECNKNNVIYMEQKKPEFYEILDKNEIAESLDLDENDIMSELPVQIVSTGLKDILIPVKSLKVLNDMKPDFDKISCISKKQGVVGYHVFTLETLNNGTAHCRNFAPLYDIPEEAATGTSNGALSCYLYKHGIIDEKSSQSLVFEQGYSMGRASEILSSLKVQNGEIVDVMVGGTALNIEEKEIEI